MAVKESVEKTIHNIRRKTRKKYSAEDKIRIVLESHVTEIPARDEQELCLQLQLGLAYQANAGFANEELGAAYRRAPGELGLWLP